ncbi:hypothetical protein TRVA0_023S01838 [Trichomonascus vanleenenianus]|uniref:uncharacterized protein n=1 Tax=Trichomonascus vanleenenianus TaxID=2268995 RepID=UPI003ECB73BD
MRVDLDDTYAVELVDPRKFSVSEAFAVGEFSMRTFQNDGLIFYIQGTEEKWDDPGVFGPNFAIKDPRQRLRDVIRKANLYAWINFCWAENLHTDVLSDRGRLFVLYEKSSGRVVGQSMWKYPDYMLDELNRDLGRTGLWWTVQKLATKLYYAYLRFVKYDYGFEPPLNNRHGMEFRKIHVKEDPPTIEELVNCSYEVLCEKRYPSSNDYLYLRYFLIDSELQGKGLGHRFFNFCLDRIPNVPIVFTHGDSKVKGPQKLQLIASPVGKYLYAKNGFKPLKYYEALENGHFIGVTDMERNR